VDLAVVDVVLLVLPATVVDEVVDTAMGMVVVVVANPLGSSMRNVATAWRATAGGRGMVTPLGRNAIVISWPFVNRRVLAWAAGTMWPVLAVGELHVSTSTWPGLVPQSLPFLYTRGGPGLVAMVVVVVEVEVELVDDVDVGLPALVVDVVVGDVVVVVLDEVVVLPAGVVVVVVDEVVVVGTGTGLPGTERMIGVISAPSMLRKPPRSALAPTKAAGSGDNPGSIRTT